MLATCHATAATPCVGKLGMHGLRDAPRMPGPDPHAPLPPGVIRLLVLLATLLGSWFIVQTYFERSGRAISLRSWLGECTAAPGWGHSHQLC